MSHCVVIVRNVSIRLHVYWASGWGFGWTVLTALYSLFVTPMYLHGRRKNKQSTVNRQHPGTEICNLIITSLTVPTKIDMIAVKGTSLSVWIFNTKEIITNNVLINWGLRGGKRATTVVLEPEDTSGVSSCQTNIPKYLTFLHVHLRHHYF